jgi:S-adenosylmethionine decarboxylase
VAVVASDQPLALETRDELEQFGEHITLDGYGGDPASLNDESLVRSALVDLCALLGMHPLASPMVVSAPDNQLKDPGGWSGFLMIAESHLSIHTFPKRRFLSADAYTCRNGIQVTTVTAFFTERFGLDEVETNFIRRGLRYPARNIA